MVPADGKKVQRTQLADRKTKNEMGPQQCRELQTCFKCMLPNDFPVMPSPDGLVASKGALAMNSEC